MKDFLDIALPIFFGAAMIFALFKLVQKKGFMGMLFNAEILETIGEVGSEKDNTFKTAVKVHVLKGENSNNNVGIEFKAKSALSFQLMPFTVTSDDAKRLALSLIEASDK